MLQLGRYILLAALASPIVATGVSFAEPSADTIKAASRSLVKITASDCTGSSKQGSGFVWKDSSRVVTALHVVAGCTTISGWNQETKKTTQLRVTNQLTKADLALLSVNDDHGWPALQTENNEVAVNEVLKAIGYGYGVNSWHDVDLKKSAGDATLRKAIPAEAWQQLQQAGLMEDGTQVIRAQGHLVSGMSGAPVINKEGLLVGIGDGGLEKGAASISWVMPASYLSELETAGNTANVNTQNLTVAFSADVNETDGKTIQCGGITFKKSRTRPFSALAPYADNPEAINLIMNALGVNPQGFNYDIYESPKNGGVVALPAGIEIQGDGYFCAGEMENFDITVGFSGGEAPNLQQINNLSIEFDANIVQATGYFFQPDPEVSYLGAWERGDGFITTRKGYYALNATTGFPQAYLYETLMTKGTEFIGVAALMEHIPPQNFQYCLLNQYDPNCGSEFQLLLKDWTQTMLGLFLSTFPFQQN